MYLNNKAIIKLEESYKDTLIRLGLVAPGAIGGKLLADHFGYGDNIGVLTASGISGGLAGRYLADKIIQNKGNKNG